jgi:hypothetical protein
MGHNIRYENKLVRLPLTNNFNQNNVKPRVPFSNVGCQLLSVIMLSVILLSVVMLCIVMLSVAAPRFSFRGTTSPSNLDKVNRSTLQSVQTIQPH